MLRKLGLLILAATLGVAACGRQVTPNPVGVNTGTGLQSGFIRIKFSVAQPFDFTDYRYVIVFNTSGSGGTPYNNAALTNWQNFSFAFVVGGNGSGTVGSPVFLQYVNQGNGNASTTIQDVVSPNLVQFNPNSNGQNTQFTITFSQTLFNGQVNTPTPSPAASATASTSPSASPSVSPSASASPSPSPAQGYSTTVYFNAFTMNSSSYDSATTLDAMGQGGAQDTSFQGGPLDLNSVFQNVYNVPAGAVLAPAQSAQITSVEIDNQPF